MICPPSPPQHEEQILVVGQEEDGLRLDRFLASVLSGETRSRIQKAIRLQQVLVEGTVAWKTGIPVHAGQEIAYAPPAAWSELPTPHPGPLEVLYQDSVMAVVSKPAGQVVHPAPGVQSPTLLASLLYHFPDLAHMGGARPGMVHRLDRGTSGLLVIARTVLAREFLASQFLERTVFKGYLALVAGERNKTEGIISRPIERHPRFRQRFTSLGGCGREAVTRWKTLASDKGYSLLAVRIFTGRTHQIRVHLADDGFPVLGDPMYGLKRQARWMPHPLPQRLQLGPMLHATVIRVAHPRNHCALTFSNAPAADFLEVVNALVPSGSSLLAGHISPMLFPHEPEERRSFLNTTNGCP